MQRGSPSQVKGAGFRSLSRRGSWVRIPPPAPQREPTSKGNIINVLFWMKKQGYAESTIRTTARRLKHLSSLCNLDDPERVKEVIASKECSEGYKRNLVNDYLYYLKAHGLSWEKPRYQKGKRLPKVPSKEAIDKIIARATWQKATIFSILRDTGMAPSELRNTRMRDIDLDRGVISAPGMKGHLPRSLKLKPSTLALLKRYMAGHSEEYPFPTRKAMSDAWMNYRKKAARNFQDPTLNTIRLYDLRHYFGTMLYHKTKDILYVKQQMGHSRIQTTLIYAQLISFGEDEWIVKVASSVKESTELISQGFEYVATQEGKLIYRKPKL